MPLNPQALLLYLITRGATRPETTPASKEFTRVLQSIEAAVVAKIDLVQIREKRLTARVLYKLAESAAEITKTTGTRLVINDRSDIAFGAGADGVHLTTHSLRADVIRETFGGDFLIGVSTHSLEEAETARRGGADFVVFGPVFETSLNHQHGRPVGPAELAKVTSKLAPFPVMALGGVTIANAAACVRAGAQGIAAIRMFSDPLELGRVVKEIRANFDNALD